MTGTTLKKFVLTPVILSAAVFGALTLPLAAFGSKPVTIQFQQEPLFHGQLRDVASPYLGLTTALSLGVGLASISVTGWRHSARKSSNVEAELSELAKHLKAKEEEIEALKLSETQLEASQLNEFLTEEAPQQQVIQTQNHQPTVEPLVISTSPLDAQPVVPASATPQAAAAKFASAQTFLGYTQSQSAVKPSAQANSPVSAEAEELHKQLQHIMAQMAAVQTALSSHANTVQAQAPSKPVQPQATQTWSVH